MPTDHSERTSLDGDAILVVGVTGAPAAGKSTVARFLAEAGCSVIDVDRLGHAVLDLDPVRDTIAAEFGAEVVGSDGRLDRALLAAKAFRDEAGMERLEALVHPIVRERIDSEIAAARATGPRAIIIDAALLFEGTLHALCDITVVVHAPEDLRAQRVRAERNWDASELERRQLRQLPPAEKRSRADRVIENDGGVEVLRARTLALLDACAPALAERTQTEAAPTTTETTKSHETNDAGR